ncbi:MAG: S-methyl-5'-thioadenosine phosphorylase [Actinomycetota bacterium]
MPAPKKPPSAEVAVLGGSGFYRFLDDVTEVELDTPFGAPSDAIAVGDIGGRSVAFLPRHGRTHSLPPHAINYRANLWVLKELGVTRVLAPVACGSLQPDLPPGHFAICDQLVDRTSGRRDSYFDGGRAVHVSFADPFCPELRGLALGAAAGLGIAARDGGTIVVIQGPRFSTRAESAFYSRQGWDVVNMTAYPEASLARELELCYVNLSLVTDYDVGLEGMPAVTTEAVVRVLRENNERVQRLLLDLIPRIPAERTCPCATALSGAGLD